MPYDVELNLIVFKTTMVVTWNKSNNLFATLQTRRELGRVNFHKDFWDCY